MSCTGLAEFDFHVDYGRVVHVIRDSVIPR